MSFVSTGGGAALVITMPTWVWAVLGLLLILGVASLLARFRGRY